MPEEWLASLETGQAEHEIEHVDVENENCGFDVLMPSAVSRNCTQVHRSVQCFEQRVGDSVQLGWKDRAQTAYAGKLLFSLRRVFPVFRHGANQR